MNFILIKTDFAQTEQQLSRYALACVCWDASDGVVYPNWAFLLQPVPRLAAPTRLLTATDVPGLQTQPGQGGFHTNGIPVCATKGSSSKGGLDHPSQWQPQKHPWVWSLVACGATAWQSHRWAFKNWSIIFLCNGVSKIKQQNSVFYNYTSL